MIEFIVTILALAIVFICCLWVTYEHSKETKDDQLMMSEAEQDWQERERQSNSPESMKMLLHEYLELEVGFDIPDIAEMPEWYEKLLEQQLVKRQKLSLEARGLKDFTEACDQLDEEMKREFLETIVRYSEQ